MDFFGLKGLMLGTLLKCVLAERELQDNKLEIDVVDLYSTRSSQNISLSIQVNKKQLADIYILDREIMGSPVKQDATFNSLMTLLYSQLVDGEWTLNSESGALQILSYSEAGSKIIKYTLNNKMTPDQYKNVLILLRDNINDPNIAKCKNFIRS